MASPAMGMPQGSGAPATNPGQGPVGGTANSDPRMIIAEFRQLAQKIQELAGKYPEFTQAAAKMLPEIQKSMSQIVGNPNRVQDKAAPPA